MIERSGGCGPRFLRMLGCIAWVRNEMACGVGPEFSDCCDALYSQFLLLEGLSDGASQKLAFGVQLPGIHD